MPTARETPRRREASFVEVVEEATAHLPGPAIRRGRAVPAAMARRSRDRVSVGLAGNERETERGRERRRHEEREEASSYPSGPRPRERVEREHAGGGRHRPGSLQPEGRETTVMDLQKPPWNFYFPGIQLLLLILFLFSYLNLP